jgi:hypothetical protein
MALSGYYHQAFVCDNTERYKKAFEVLRSREFNRYVAKVYYLSRQMKNHLIQGFRSHQSVVIKCVDSKTIDKHLFSGECKPNSKIHTYAFVHQNSKDLYLCENNIRDFKKNDFCFLFEIIVHESFHFLASHIDHSLVYLLGEGAKEYCQQNSVQ